VPGVYKCAALFPSAATSLKLGSNNLHLFRCVVGEGVTYVVAVAVRRLLIVH
jgi:hypothetical protein